MFDSRHFTFGRWERDFGDFFKDLQDDLRRTWAEGTRRVRFERGDMRYVILALLEDHPMHGYEIIRELERRFNGRYSPSAGTVYPTLQLLEDMGYVSSTQSDGKRIYAITGDGRAFLDEGRDRVEEIFGRAGAHGRGAGREEWELLRQEIRMFMTSLRILGRDVSPEQINRLRDLLTHTRHEMEEILRSAAPER